MTAVDVAIGLLLALMVIVEVACGLGVLLMPSALDRLHFLAPASIFGPITVAAAVWVRHGLTQPSLKATLVMLLVLVTGPVLAHVTAAAAAARSGTARAGHPR